MLFRSVSALICGYLSFSQIRTAAGRIDGRGPAIVGLITGYLTLALLVISLSTINGDHGFDKKIAVQSDIQTIGTQLKAYESTNGFLPTTEQGLEALVTQPTTEPRPPRWSQLFKHLPIDPWGTAYIYRSPGRKNPNGYDLYSAGKDRQADTADDVWGN